MRSLIIDESAPGTVAAVKISSPGAGRRPKWGSLELASNACTASEDTWPLLYVPSIIGHHDHYNTKPRGPWSALSGIAQIAQLNLEHRVLQTLAMDGLTPATEIEGAADFKAAIVGIAQCLHWLYETVHIAHGNVSVANLMYRVVNGTVYGVLKDNDLSIVVTKNPDRQPTANQFRGTLPFMALDLLENFTSPSLLRHDLESLFYCIVWITAQYAAGKVVRPEAYKDWARLSVPTLKKEKMYFLISARGSDERPFPTEAFKKLMGNSIFSLKGMIKNGHLVRNGFLQRRALALDNGIPFNEEFDFETLGGHVTWEAFINALQS